LQSPESTPPTTALRPYLGRPAWLIQCPGAPGPPGAVYLPPKLGGGSATARFTIDPLRPNSQFKLPEWTGNCGAPQRGHRCRASERAAADFAPCCLEQIEEQATSPGRATSTPWSRTTERPQRLRLSLAPWRSPGFSARHNLNPSVSMPSEGFVGMTLGPSMAGPGVHAGPWPAAAVASARPMAH
jgi:hypothetical protein